MFFSIAQAGSRLQKRTDEVRNNIYKMQKMLCILNPILLTHFIIIIIPQKEHGILKRLRNNNRIVILKADKGNGMFVLDRKEYDGCILKIINDKSKFKILFLLQRHLCSSYYTLFV